MTIFAPLYLSSVWGSKWIMDDQDKLVLTELFTVIHEIQINAYVQNLKRGFLTDIEIHISKFKSHGYIS